MSGFTFSGMSLPTSNSYQIPQKLMDLSSSPSAVAIKCGFTKQVEKDGVMKTVLNQAEYQKFLKQMMEASVEGHYGGQVVRVAFGYAEVEGLGRVPGAIRFGNGGKNGKQYRWRILDAAIPGLVAYYNSLRNAGSVEDQEAIVAESAIDTEEQIEAQEEAEAIAAAEAAVAEANKKAKRKTRTRSRSKSKS